MNFVVIFQLLCKIVPLKHSSLITKSICMDPKYSVIKGLHCIPNIRPTDRLLFFHLLLMVLKTFVKLIR